jgi:RNA polymerase sigma factor FliA
VHKVAKKIARRLPRVVNVDDLVGAGTLGLIDALSRFDPKRSDRFAAYAEIRIRGAILDELRAMDWLPRTQRARVRRAAEGQPQENAPKASLEAVVLVDDVRDDGFDGFAGDVPTAASPFENKERSKHLTAAIAKLPMREQQILSLYYVEELTLKQIGQIFGVTESRVCQLHSHAVARLRKELGNDVEI